MYVICMYACIYKCRYMHNNNMCIGSFVLRIYAIYMKCCYPKCSN